MGQDSGAMVPEPKHFKRPRAPKEVRTPYDGIRPHSALSHFIGILLSVAGLVLLEVAALLYGNVWHIVSFGIYGVSLIGLYTASTFYHILPLKERGRWVLRVIDHMMIYILIAGTYTPICLVALRESGAWGWAIFGVIWGCAAAGLAITVIFKNTPRIVSSIVYIVMGWIVIIAFWPLSQRISMGGIGWLLGGGLFYTVGGVLYGLKWPGKNNARFGFHEVFHIFVMCGSICHYMLMLLYIVKL